jgi:uncharacterized protein YndB with AHSA1/START domain
MAPMVFSTDVARRPEEVFAYLADPARLPEWQESAVSARLEGEGPPAVGSKALTVRRVGRGERPMTMEITNLDPPRSLSVRGIDGPVRGLVEQRVEPLDDGGRSRVTVELDFEGHGIGKLLVPLVVRRQAKAEMPRNMEKLRERLESGA